MVLSEKIFSCFGTGIVSRLIFSNNDPHYFSLKELITHQFLSKSYTYSRCQSVMITKGYINGYFAILLQ